MAFMNISVWAFMNISVTKQEKSRACLLVFLMEIMLMSSRLACVEGRCQGYNEYRNMFNAGRHFTTFLLPHGAPPALRPLISDVVGTFENCSLNTRELVTWMDKVVHLYRTGRYLNRTAAKDFETSKFAWGRFCIYWTNQRSVCLWD